MRRIWASSTSNFNRIFRKKLLSTFLYKSTTADLLSRSAARLIEFPSVLMFSLNFHDSRLLMHFASSFDGCVSWLFAPVLAISALLHMSLYGAKASARKRLTQRNKNATALLFISNYACRNNKRNNKKSQQNRERERKDIKNAINWKLFLSAFIDVSQWKETIEHETAHNKQFFFHNTQTQWFSHSRRRARLI